MGALASGDGILDVPIDERLRGYDIANSGDDLLLYGYTYDETTKKIMVMRTDGQGNAKQAITISPLYGYTNTQYIKGTSDGGFVGLSTQNHGRNDGVWIGYEVFKVDAAGNVQWQTQLSTNKTTQDYIRDITETKDGYMAVGGVTVKLDKNGTQLHYNTLPKDSFFSYITPNQLASGYVGVAGLTDTGRIASENDLGGMVYVGDCIETPEGCFIGGSSSNHMPMLASVNTNGDVMWQSIYNIPSKAADENFDISKVFRLQDT